MYAGPGAGPMMATASAWDALAAQLDSYAAGYSAVISELTGQSWSGGTADAMAGAAAPYVAWLTTTAAQAEQAAGQARAAAAAYEIAFAATVPPMVVAANRTQLATLVATNFFGQNTPAIAATEAAYAEMWAQDAAAMYGYAAASSAAAMLTPFSEPPQTTNPTGQSAQAAAVAHAVSTSSAEHAQTALPQLMAAVPPQLQTLASGGSGAAPSSSLVSAVGAVNTLLGPLSLGQTTAYSVFQAGNFVTGAQLAALQAAKSAAPAATHAITAASTAPATGGVRGEVLAGVNTADRVGKLSVPQGWAAAAPEPVDAGTPLRPTAFRALPAWAANPPMGTPGGTPGVLGPMSNVAGRRTGNAVFRMRDRRYKIPRPAVGG
ncbi:hypothetical protein A5707_10920 [Mycobacterium kyorinense]|uniref:PPE family protein n=1 Tax=Mycobacterium kyorinense TaxID=487514 RepID=A0A1A2YRC2_9MYCO|nr:hypothetical protein A5707_10920 [Mycobacterium kyorinense]